MAYDPDLRHTDWHKAGDNLAIREIRPMLKSPLQCPYEGYDVVKFPKKVEHEGACRNYQLRRLRCVFCHANYMSCAALGIEFDARERADRIMGW